MSVYTGWQDDLLTVASLPRTARNRAFLTAWHANADSNCKLNPIDLTSHNSGSTKCSPAGLSGVNYQAYSDRVWTRTAFAAQIKSGDYPHLRAALKSGNPYTVSDPADVTSDLNRWQSFKFATAYLDQATQGPPPQLPHAPQALKGWADMQKSVNRNMPNALNQSARIRRHALRQLDRARKVRF